MALSGVSTVYVIEYKGRFLGTGRIRSNFRWHDDLMEARIYNSFRIAKKRLYEKISHGLPKTAKVVSAKVAWNI